MPGALLALLVSTLAAPPASAACGVSDRRVQAPASMKAPGKGGSYVDPAFGCKVTRLTDAKAEGSPGGITHQYSSVSPFNSDSTLVLVERSNGVVHARDLSGRIVRDELHNVGILPTSGYAWSRKIPSLIYFHTAGNELKSFDVRSGELKSLHKFSRYAKVSFGMGEGDISWDGDKLAVVGDGKWGFIHDIATGKNTPAKDLSAYGAFLDNVDVTPRGRFTLIHDQPGGTELFDAGMNHLGKAVDYQGHSDRGRDKDGSDLLVITNSADATPIANCQNGIVKARLPGGPETCLLPLDWSIIVHVSCNNVGLGWCLVSTYSRGTQHDHPYKNELLKVPLDGSPVLRLAHSRSSNSGYDRLPRAAVSPDGRWALFDSDMAGGVPDVYLLDLGAAKAPPAEPSRCDLDGDGAVDGRDLAALADAPLSGAAAARFDLDGDGRVGPGDARILGEVAAGTRACPARRTAVPRRSPR